LTAGALESNSETTVKQCIAQHWKVSTYLPH
jgi:hypothetical protein